jgi:Arc/MetJ-type ribon-helix-helix transcriptional regulator
MNYEKVSINVDNKLLAKIDLLVSEGFYSTRSDFIV